MAVTGPVVVLVGAPGAGKTTVGQLVAERLDVEFRDTDADIEAAAGATIAGIFFDDGEEAFRRLEEVAVGNALSEHRGVLALGGGAVLSQLTRQRLAGQRVIWLRVGLAKAALRVGFARERPVLALNPRAMLRTLLDERRPLYEEVAMATVDTDEGSPSEVADAVVSVLRSLA